MNLPNQLTVFRMALIPVFLFFLYWDGAEHHILFALIVFAAASLTDTLDGYLARKHQWITDFGKLMDPLADKLLVMAALVAFIERFAVPAVAVVVILAREFLVTALRQLAAASGSVLAADRWGKLKTILQMFWVVYTLLYQWMAGAFLLSAGTLRGMAAVFWVGMAAVTAVTVFSGVNYMVNNRALFRDR